MRLLLAFAFAAVASAQSLEYNLINEDLLRNMLQMASPKNEIRYTRLKSLFSEAGCVGDKFSEQAVKHSKVPNLICDLEGTGESRRRIIVGAHFDSVGPGDGIIDNWSGAILLPSLEKVLAEKPRRHQFEFVAFAGEEDGLLGSRTYVKAIPKEDRGQIAAVVTMDSLGLTPTKFLPVGSDKELVITAARLAQALKLQFGGVDIQIGITDSASFKVEHIPVLSLHSVTQETWGIINGSKDVWKNVSWKDYYDSYRLISALLVYLDTTLP